MAQILALDAVRRAELRYEPYTYFLGSAFLNGDRISALRDNFPAITKPGFLTVDEVQLKGPFKTMIDELEGPELTAVLSDKFEQDLSPFPRLTTIRKISQLKDGSIHTDGRSKVMTLLLYMNDDWQANGDGRLRVLYNGKDFEPYAAEVPPTMGSVFGFLRADNSWHGHLPFAGERRVVQVAWIRDAKALERKKKRNRSAQFFKSIFGR
jgi:SM-20-related protein